MDKIGFTLDKSYTVHLKEDGEMCNRLARGTRVIPVQQRGEWIKITWRSGKKKGWIRVCPQASDIHPEA